MSILVARHGPVSLAAPKAPNRVEFAAYVESYEDCGIDCDAIAPTELVERIRACETVFASPAPRALQSLRVIDPRRAASISAVFLEERQLVPELPGRWPLLVWFSIARGTESFDPRQAARRLAMRRRAEAACDLLVAEGERGDVGVIGHGWFNRAISSALLQRGWRRRDVKGGLNAFGRVSGAWGHAVFER